MVRIGSIKLDRINDANGLRHMLIDLPVSNVYIVKPNWYSPHPYNFTDAHALDILIGALPGRAIVVEGYSGDRHDGTMCFTVDGKRVDWRWILNHPDWGWIKSGGNLENLRKWDNWFLENYGFTDVFHKYGAEYVRVTEEIWEGRVVDHVKVKKRVEKRFESVRHERMYQFMPSLLAEYEGAPLISLGRVKGYNGNYPSLTMKNLFGLIPDPLRSWWHGPNDLDLSRNIIDIMKIYASYFTLFGICEAFTSFTIDEFNGKIKVPWGSYSIANGDGFVAVGNNLLELDVVLCGLINVDVDKVGYLSEGAKAFGSYDPSVIHTAKMVSAKWFNPKTRL